MAVRVTAEFETPDLAETALRRIKETTEGIHSTNMIYNKTSNRAMKLRNGSIYTIIPTAVTTHTYFTATMVSPASEDVISEPQRSRKTRIYIICEPESTGKVRAVLGAMGALDISVHDK